MCQRCGVCAKDVPCVDYAIRVGPEEARLEALAVLLEAARLLAVTALVVAAQRVGVRVAAPGAEWLILGRNAEGLRSSVCSIARLRISSFSGLLWQA